MTLLTHHLKETFLFVLFFGSSLCLSAYSPEQGPRPSNNDWRPSTTLLADCNKKSEYCTGTRKYADGSVYEGEFRFGKAHGWGKIVWPDGSTYEGEFQHDFRHGEGTQKLSNGATYEGSWKSGFMDGKGTYTYACGHRYTGDFVEDQMEGTGTILMANGESYEGNWKNNLPNGAGVFTRVDQSRYIGNNKKGKRHGEGLVIIENEVEFSGNWTNGLLNGAATFNFANGNKIISYWKNGHALPRLVFQEANGKVSETDWNTIHSKAFKHKAQVALAWYLAASESMANKDSQNAKEQLKRAKIFAPAGHSIHQWTVLQHKVIQQRNSPKDCF